MGINIKIRLTDRVDIKCKLGVEPTLRLGRHGGAYPAWQREQGAPDNCYHYRPDVVTLAR
jgi:hypothetical protein